MARAKREQLNQKVPVTTYRIEPQPATYILELTEDEAGVLLSLTSHVSGNFNGRRGLVNNIQSALLSTGLPQGRYGKKFGISGTVHFDYYNARTDKTETVEAAQNTSGPVKSQDVVKAETPSVTSTGSRAEIRRVLFREAYGPMPTLPVMAEPALLAFERKLLAAKVAEQQKQAMARLEQERKERDKFHNEVMAAYFAGEIDRRKVDELKAQFAASQVQRSVMMGGRASSSLGAGTSPNQGSVSGRYPICGSAQMDSSKG